MNDLLTTPAELPPHQTRHWFSNRLSAGLARLAYYRELGSTPDLCPDYRAAQEEHEHAIAAALVPVLAAAAQLAAELRQRYEIAGPASLEDLWRVMAAEGSRLTTIRRNRGGWLIGDELHLPEAPDPERERHLLAWGLGHHLCARPHAGFDFDPRDSLDGLRALLTLSESVVEFFEPRLLFGSPLTSAAEGSEVVL